jgi:hypothetical protein
MGAAAGGHLHHTAWVVSDVDAAARTLTDAVGLGPWDIRTVEPVETRWRGEVVPFAFRVGVAPLGGSRYELVGPASEGGPLHAHLAEHGEGFHHSCIGYDSRAAMQAARDELAAAGHELVVHADLGDAGEFAYVAVPGAIGLLELLYLAG